MNEHIRNFCDHHGIRVIDQNKRAYRYTKLNYDYFQYSKDYNIVDQHIAYETEPLWTVEVTESELERIAEFESQIFNNLKQHGHYRMFENMMEQKSREKFLKEKYPAVKKAYEHYSLVLKLAESGDL
jgi:hypothetical protein